MQILSLSNERAILNKDEAADFLRIKRRTLDDWMRRGRIPYIKLPSKAVRFRADQLLEFLGKFETGGSAK
jgi:excisionase family DNA binding protein